MARLINPATERMIDAIMNGHFFPRKSKFVFLNNSIRHCLPNLAGPADVHPLLLDMTPPSGILFPFFRCLKP
jgi:hypothetical protein